MSTQKTCKEQHLVQALVQCSQWWTDEHCLHWRSRDTFGLIWCLHMFLFFSEDCWAAEFDSRKQIHDGNSSLGSLVLRALMTEPGVDELLFSNFGFGPFVLSTCGHVGSKKSNDISCQRTQYVHLPQFMYTPNGRYVKGALCNFKVIDKSLVPCQRVAW